MTHATQTSKHEETPPRPRELADQLTANIREVAKSMLVNWPIDEAIVMARRWTETGDDIRWELVAMALEEMLPLPQIDPFTADEGEG